MSTSRHSSPGDGSVYYRPDKGLWVAAVTVATGRRRTIYGKTKAEVKRKLIAAQRDHQLGLLPTGRAQTVEQVLTAWLERAAKPRVRPKTYITYRQLLHDHIIPKVGSIPVERLRPEQVQALLNAKSAEGLSPRSVFHLRAVLRAGINNAVRWGAVPRNVVTLTDAPRVPSEPVQVLSQEQARTLLDAARGHELEGLLTVAVGLGLRQGEALGLRWLDVDLNRGELHIRHALQRIDGQLVLVEPKTEKSRRTIVMPAVVTAALWDHRQRERERRQVLLHDSGFVFCRPDGRPLDGTGVTKRFQRLLATAGLPRDAVPRIAAQRREPDAGRRRPAAGRPGDARTQQYRYHDGHLRPRPGQRPGRRGRHHESGARRWLTPNPSLGRSQKPH